MQSIRAKKSLGQNFLIDEEALSDIARSITLAEKHIIEIGPWYGALTEYIISHHPLSLDLVELDTDMVKILDARFMGEDFFPKIPWDESHLVKTTPIDIHHQDVLTFIPSYDKYSVIANIPYYITSPILFHFLYPYLKNSFWSPEEMTIMMQEEVGEKILEWRARKPHYSFLSLAMEQACENIEIIRYVGRESFDPAPKVDSIVLKFTVKRNRDQEQEKKLLNLWKMAFTHPRKTLLSNLKWTIYNRERIQWILNSLGYNEKVRAEAIIMDDWKAILK